MIKKFPKYPVDAVAIDLEDGIPESEKAVARDRLPDVVAFLKKQHFKGMIFVRINGSGSAHLQADLAAVRRISIDGLVIPKLETEADLRVSPDSIPIIGIVETARGVANVEGLVGQTKSNLVALAFGAEDFITDLGGRRTSDGLEVLYARSRVILAARLGGLHALDQVFAGIRDDGAFRRDAHLGRQLGYGGKMCITPRQVEIANDVFSPSTEEIDRSRRLIQTYEAAQAQGKGTIEFEGSMVDEPLLKRARAILQAAESHE